MRERTRLDGGIKAIDRVEQGLADNLELIEMGEAEGDDEVVAEAEQALEELKEWSAKQEIETLLSGEADANDCYLEIHAGAGDDLITGVQAMTHFWGNPITTRYLVKRGNPIYGALRFMCPTLPTLGPAAAPILFKCGTICFHQRGQHF